MLSLFRKKWDLLILANELSKKEFHMKYKGSLLGVFWAFIQPVITISILWFVFSVGFKSVPVDNVPFILWLITGIIPWFFISEVLSNGASSVSENAFLVKKVVFKIEILPIVKVISALKIHLFFIAVLIIIYIYYGYSLNVYNFQLLYYLFSAIVLTIGVNFLTSALNVFFKDIGQVVAMIVQFGFWVTPIFWMVAMVPDSYHFLIKLNPVYYIVEGYRLSMFSQELVSDHPYLTIYFWIFSLILLVVSYTLFKKLKPHFADVI